ncbi:unnamed protein product [Triticum turgidum subsp. durum]|uniref:Uncharacterized protein n=1 Tax=Triticum turgidum subsp. durum TaxID=4567 RepID=A0A9R1QVT9_TRITD|nr:unnamed protein product [Triticum turgidum subsp. durum]
MATAGNAPRSCKRVEATVLKRVRNGSAFTRCEACNKDVAIVLIHLQSCSLDSKIRLSLGAFQPLPSSTHLGRVCLLPC